MYNAGKNLMTMLANGITNDIKQVENAATKVGQAIWSKLGFHSPTKEGPGSDAGRSL